MIDLHSHILPGVDDGSASVEESLEMLRLSRQQGVDMVFATPHFSATKENPQSFLARRNAAAAQLQLDPDTMPRLRLGAEVAYFSGLHRCEDLRKLCLEGTDYLLLEMPFGPWSDRMVSEVCDIRPQLGLTPVLAHIERYSRKDQMGRYRAQLMDAALFQCNAEYFLKFATKRKALRQLEGGQIHFLGSDAHNLTHRVPCMGAAAQVIAKKLGSEIFSQMDASILAP